MNEPGGNMKIFVVVGLPAAGKNIGWLYIADPPEIGGTSLPHQHSSALRECEIPVDPIGVESYVFPCTSFRESRYC
jgi:hypothetical protein